MKTFHKHVVSILSLTHTRSKKTSKFRIFFSLNILMKHDQQKCGNKKESNIYGGIFFGIIFLQGKEIQKQPVEWIPVNIVLPILELFAKDQGWCICRKTPQNHKKTFSYDLIIQIRLNLKKNYDIFYASCEKMCLKMFLLIQLW